MKRNAVIYWVTTIFLSIGMLVGLGVWKILGVIVILLPKLPLIKEWAYAGFFFAMSGAAISHLIVGQPFTEALPSMILLMITVLSWIFRPADRKLTSINS